MRLSVTSSFPVGTLAFLAMACLPVLSLLIGCVDESGKPMSPGADSASAESEAVRWPDNRPLPPVSEPGIRIRTDILDPPFSPVVVGEPGQRLVLLEEDRHRVRLLSAPLECHLLEDAGWSVSDSAGRRLQTSHPCTLRVGTLVGESPQITCNGAVLPGAIDFVPVRPSSDDGAPSSLEPIPVERVDVVVELDLESYLAGVLDAELYGHWPLETFKAQAVAARSFAVAESSYWRPKRHFDLVAGPASQAWAGPEASDRARKAVALTRGKLLLHRGRVIPAYYSSSCGGVPSSALDAISNRSSHDIPPLMARPAPGPCCEGAPVREWDARFPLRAVEKAVSELFEDDPLQGIAGIEVAERNRAGRPLVYSLRDRGGNIRSLDAASLRSLLGRLPRVGGKPPATLRSDALEPRIVDAVLVVEGRGFGHGVGLCQFGAFERGRSGASWEEMIQEFYPGSTLHQSWE